MAQTKHPRTFSPIASIFIGLTIATTILLMIEAGLRWADISNPDTRADPFIGFTGQTPLFQREVDENGEAWMSVAEIKYTSFNPQRFPENKASDVRRVFCLGGSTTYGRPYTDKTSFCGWLRLFLNEADSQHRWEVINTGGISYSSYRVSVLMEELLTYKPDLLIVYSGQNEFLEKRTYTFLANVPPALLRVFGRLSRTRIYGLLQELILQPPATTVAQNSPQPQNKPGTNTGTSPDDDPGDFEAMLDVTEGWNEYQRSLLQRKGTENHYRYNLTRMADMARAAQVPMLWILPASNLKDMSPFKSESGITHLPEKMKDFFHILNRAEHEADPGIKRSLLEEAVKMDPQHALALFLLAQSQLASGELKAAADSYQRALDEDILPLRLTSALEEGLRSVARQEGIPLIDYPSLLKAENRRLVGHEILGQELFLDHVHPTIEGHQLLALSIFRWMETDGFFKQSPDWNEKKVADLTDKVIASLDRKALADAMTMLSNVMSWARKDEESYNHSLRAYELSSESPLALSHLISSAIILKRIKHSYALFADALNNGKTPEYVLAALEDALKNIGKDKPQAQVNYLKGLVSEMRDNPRMLFISAMAFIRIKNLDLAVGTFNQLLKLEPDHLDAHYNLAMALSELQRFNDSVPHFQAFTKRNPDNALAFNNMGVSLAQTGQLKEARLAFLRALKIDPTLKTAQNSLARVEQLIQNQKPARNSSSRRVSGNLNESR